MSNHFLPVGSSQEFGLAREQIGEETHIIGVVGNDEEIQWAGQLRWLSARRDDFFATGEAKRFPRPESRAKRACVKRSCGMQVCIAEERTGRKIATRVRGVCWLGRKHLLG